MKATIGAAKVSTMSSGRKMLTANISSDESMVETKTTACGIRSVTPIPPPIKVLAGARTAAGVVVDGLRWSCGECDLWPKTTTTSVMDF
jgi:hypothetical protein